MPTGMNEAPEDVRAINLGSMAICVFIGIATFAIFAYFGRDDVGKIAASSSISLAVILFFNSPKLRYLYYQITLSIFFVLHIALICAFFFGVFHMEAYTLSAAATLDMISMAVIIYAVKRALHKA